MRIVGQSRPIHDARAKVTGSLRYVGDMHLPGMLHAALVYSTIPHGRVLKVEAARALALPGVVAVLDCFGQHGEAFCRYRSVKGQKALDQERVFNQHVRFVGDRVACVLAESEGLARAAARLVAVEYEEFPYALTAAETLSGAINNVHPEGAVYGGIELEVGEKPTVDITIHTESELARIDHLAIEPHGCLADYQDGHLTIYSPNQSVHGIRTVIADIFGLRYHRVRVVKTTMGGSFGGKQEWVLEPVAAAAALAVQRPVKLVLSREEVFTSTVSRAPMRLVMDTGFTSDGRLKSVALDNTLDAGAYVGNSLDYCHAMSKKLFRCYKYPHLSYSARAVITNTPVSGAFRGWSSPEAAIALEHNLNQAARRLNIDPLELRLINAARPGDTDISLDISLGDFRLAECLEQGRARFDWAERKQRVSGHNRSGSRFLRGLGVACGGHLNGYYPKFNDFAEAGLRMTEDGAAILNATLHDHGCGTVTAFKMIVAEALGISDDLVEAREGDTAVTPFDYGCYSSRTTFVIGRAAYNAALLLKERLEIATARITGRERANMRAKDGRVCDTTDPGFSLSYAEVSQGSLSQLKEELSVTAQYINQSNPGVAGAHFAEVEVDTATGLTRIVDYLAIHDIGQAINHAHCVAQIQGAVLMGAGAALCEKVSVDARGRATASLKDYHLINAFEAPNIMVELIESAGADGPFGAKSIGEVCHAPVAPAIMGAVNDALGTAECRLPLNPDTIVRLLKEKGYRYAVEF